MGKYQTEKLIAFMKLRDELAEHEKKGVSLALEGKHTTADEIARACIFCEDVTYMRDYITDEDTINFNRIKKK